MLNSQHKVQKSGFVWGMGIQNFRDLFSRKMRSVCYQCSPWKSWARKHREGWKNVINAVSNIFDFRKNDYNLAENTKFLAKSNFNNSANVGPLTKNDGALESWHQGEFVFATGQGAGKITKIYYQSRANRQYIVVSRMGCHTSKGGAKSVLGLMWYA